MLEVFEGIVGDGDHHKPHGTDRHQLAQHGAKHRGDAGHATAGQLQQGLQVALDRDPYQQAEQAHLDQGLEELHQTLDGEDLLGPLNRIDLLDIRLDRFATQQKPVLGDMRDNRYQHRDRQDRNAEIGQLLHQILHHVVECLGKGAVEVGFGDHHQLAKMLQIVIGHRHQHADQAQDDGGGDHLLALGDLPLLAGIP
ncbi:hypothetical protein D3C80_1204400 [compost metagenome]